MVILGVGGVLSCLVLLADDSELIVFKPDGQAYSEIKRYKVDETVTYAHPLIVGNRIFVKDEATVTMWTIEGSTLAPVFPPADAPASNCLSLCGRGLRRR